MRLDLNIDRRVVGEVSRNLLADRLAARSTRALVSERSTSRLTVAGRLVLRQDENSRVQYRALILVMDFSPITPAADACRLRLEDGDSHTRMAYLLAPLLLLAPAAGKGIPSLEAMLHLFGGHAISSWRDPSRPAIPATCLLTVSISGPDCLTCNWHHVAEAYRHLVVNGLQNET